MLRVIEKFGRVLFGFCNGVTVVVCGDDVGNVSADDAGEVEVMADQDAEERGHCGDQAGDGRGDGR